MALDCGDLDKALLGLYPPHLPTCPHLRNHLCQ